MPPLFKVVLSARLQMVSASNQLYLRRDIFYCTAEGTHIFLDVKYNRYFTLNSAQSSWFTELVSSRDKSELSPDARRFLDSLVRSGVIVLKPEHGRHLVPCSRPNAAENADPPAQEPFSGSVLLPAIRTFAETRFMQSFFSFHSVISRARDWKSKCAPHIAYSLDDVQRTTALIHSVTPLMFTAREECFFRSLFLFRYLTRLQARVDWEFGIIPHPFSAHCWIEYEGHPLNDETHNTQNYSKIMSV